MTDRPGTDQHDTTRPETDAPYLIVTFGDPAADPATWRQMGVQTAIRNRIAYEMEAHRKGYAPLTSGAIYTMWRYVAWDALRLRGEFAGTLVEFADQCLDVRALDDGEPVPSDDGVWLGAPGPTLPGHSSE